MRAACNILGLGIVGAIAAFAVRGKQALSLRAGNLGGVASIFDLSVRAADGKQISLGSFRGSKAILVVNVASE